MSARSLTKGRAQAIVGMMVPWEASWAPLGWAPGALPCLPPTPTQLSAETFSWLWAPSLQTGEQTGSTLRQTGHSHGCLHEATWNCQEDTQLGMKTQHLTGLPDLHLPLTPNSGRSQTSSPAQGKNTAKGEVGLTITQLK